MRSLPLVLLFAASTAAAQNWPQFGHDPQHGGKVERAAQPLKRILADVEYDPFVELEQETYDGDLLVHFQVPIVDGDDVFMEHKSGTFTGFTWQTQDWSIHRLHWENGSLVDKWTAPS